MKSEWENDFHFSVNCLFKFPYIVYKSYELLWYFFMDFYFLIKNTVKQIYCEMLLQLRICIYYFNMFEA